MNNWFAFCMMNFVITNFMASNIFLESFSVYISLFVDLFQQSGDKSNETDKNLNNITINNSINNNNNENNNPRVKSAAVVFIKEKNGRFQVMREPFMLEKCVVSQDPDYMDVFEILEWSKEAFLIKVGTSSLHSCLLN